MRRGTYVRWGVPIAAAAVIGAAIGAGPVIAAVSGDPVLPERSAQQLLADAAAAAEKSEGMPPMSGTVQQTASLGLPALPDTGDGSPLSLLSGSHEVKLWYGDEDKMRLALPTQFNETNVIVNGDQVWYWDSDSNTATRVKLQGEHPREGLPTAAPTVMTPDQAAQRLLEQVDESTTISVSNTAEVAGRPAYQLTLTPKDPASLVQEVRLAIDGEHYVPLRVQVFAKGSAEPAFQVGFTQLTFTPPAEENFAFTPPAGAKVEEKTFGPSDARQEHAEEARRTAGDLKVRGEGWTAVAVLPADAAMPQGDADGAPGAPGGEGADARALFDNVLKTATPVSGTWGSGKMIRTKLVTVLLTDDGRLLVGAVTPEEIMKAAGVR
ncbi:MULTISPECIES: LolA family protein [Nonomuraea]|uniref:Outer membrane lipoprotein carrier protein LolA n=1 Tax=Nonomuraea ferruginea TaxID=46174 RepID=A0ABT4T2N3_9ACTN|nr:outer membrane lipoprotein carrier protein LolA [Nonomuraea ferruginea]MDA0643385.1 outer membrane lipoprotein carrier protein LolA [Nonomuraea ferruginea]